MEDVVGPEAMLGSMSVDQGLVGSAEFRFWEEFPLQHFTNSQFLLKLVSGEQGGFRSDVEALESMACFKHQPLERIGQLGFQQKGYRELEGLVGNRRSQGLGIQGKA